MIKICNFDITMPSQGRESIINSNSGHRHMKRVNLVQSKKEYRSSKQSMKSTKNVRKCYRKAQKHADKQKLIADIRLSLITYMRAQAAS